MVIRRQNKYPSRPEEYESARQRIGFGLLLLAV